MTDTLPQRIEAAEGADRCKRCHGEGKLYRQDCGMHGLTLPCPECLGTGFLANEKRQCMNCTAPVTGHVMLCQQCFDDDQAYDETDRDCGNCGGEGFTYGCSWDWQCETYDEGEGTCLCTRRCEWCHPLTPAEIAERNKLRDVLATALAKDKVAELRAKDRADGE